MSENSLCGLACYHPNWLQRFANSKAFIVVYGILGTTQAMAYMYFVITLQTVEKRFKIPSQTTGLVLSGNEISQILLSLVLSYYGGQRNRPRWIAWGVVFCALSCFILAAPHFIYGAGEDALALTKEFMDAENALSLQNATQSVNSMKGANRLCLGITAEEKCDELFSIIPLVLIFLSQFILGIGNTLYYSLGQTYLDDNTKKTNTPIMLAYALSLRTFGPVVGFVLGFTSLKLYIDPTKTPLIDNKDPRWLGAWWLGWLIFGFAMLILAFFIALFPKELPKNQPARPNSSMPKALMNEENAFSEEASLNKSKYLQQKQQQQQPIPVEDPQELDNETAESTDFTTSLMRLLRNKILMYNILSTIFYILGASGYITFLAKYLEVQFHKNAADATIITGPITLFGMVAGFFLSGLVISKKKPGPRPLLMWNVIVGVMYMVGQISYLFLTCPDGKMPLVQGRLNLSTTCNDNCYCDGVSYSPVCQEESGYTFFSPCHAGCETWNADKRYYTECACANDRLTTTTNHWTHRPSDPISTTKTISYTTEKSTEKLTTTSDSISTSTQSTYTPSTLSDNVQLEEISSTNETVITLVGSGEPLVNPYYEVSETDNNKNDKPPIENTQENPNIYDEKTYYNTNKDSESRNGAASKREAQNSNKQEWGKMIPGACLKGCALGYYLFTIVASIINCFGASGRIGSMIVNFRCVAKQDKSFTQGLILMMVSLFALIPGPILYGRIIDSTCLVWSEKCGKMGNCQLYDQKTFRYYINLTAFGLTTIGVMFDLLVWYYGKNLDLYGDRDKEDAGKTLTKENNVIENEFIVK